MKRVYFSIICFLLGLSAQAVVTINGAGASFPYPLYSKWFQEYEKANAGVQFNYQSIGSGGGIRQLLKQTVDFGASDAPMGEADIKKAPWPVLHVPTVLGAVAVIYNVNGVPNALKLDGPTLAQIFLGKIKKWDHPSLKKLNPEIAFPAEDILVVRRSDGSGTTSIFSDFLCALSPAFESAVGRGKTLRWPAGIGAKGNDGVTAMVMKTSGAIGYVELAYAFNNKLSTVALKNQAGEFQLPSVAGISKSAASLTHFDDITVSIVNAKGTGVYPLSSFTYILLPRDEANAKKLIEIKKFLVWALSAGQNMAAELHYAPLPKGLSEAFILKM